VAVTVNVVEAGRETTDRVTWESCPAAVCAQAKYSAQTANADVAAEIRMRFRILNIFHLQLAS
jgi:hypothetical protein